MDCDWAATAAARLERMAENEEDANASTARTVWPRTSRIIIIVALARTVARVTRMLDEDDILK